MAWIFLGLATIVLVMVLAVVWALRVAVRTAAVTSATSTASSSPSAAPAAGTGAYERRTTTLSCSAGRRARAPRRVSGALP